MQVCVSLSKSNYTELKRPPLPKNIIQIKAFLQTSRAYSNQKWEKQDYMGKVGESVHNQERISKEYQERFSKFKKKGGGLIIMKMTMVSR